jgi:hypothetical protein
MTLRDEIVDLRGYNYKLYEKGLRTQEEYECRSHEQKAYACITAAGTLAICSICPTVGLAVAIGVSALNCLEEYFILPRNEPDAIVIEDIEVVYPDLCAVSMKGDRVIQHVDADFIDALVVLAAEFDVNYVVDLDRSMPFPPRYSFRRFD